MLRPYETLETGPNWYPQTLLFDNAHQNEDSSLNVTIWRRSVVSHAWNVIDDTTPGVTYRTTSLQLKVISYMRYL